MVVLLTYGLCPRKKPVSHLTSAARLACSCKRVPVPYTAASRGAASVTSRAHSRHTLRHCGFGEADAGMNKRSHTKCSVKCEVRSCKKGTYSYLRSCP